MAVVVGQVIFVPHHDRSSGQHEPALVISVGGSGSYTGGGGGTYSDVKAVRWAHRSPDGTGPVDTSIIDARVYATRGDASGYRAAPGRALAASAV